MDKSIEIIFQEWEDIITDIMTNGVTLMNHRQLIQKRKELISMIAHIKKQTKDAWMEQKTEERKKINALIEQWVKKTPAYEEVQDECRPQRYELEKIEIHIEAFTDHLKNRAYHLRVNEIDLNKVWIWSDDFNH